MGRKLSDEECEKFICVQYQADEVFFKKIVIISLLSGLRIAMSKKVCKSVKNNNIKCEQNTI